jgi:hypothetical protein
MGHKPRQDIVFAIFLSNRRDKPGDELSSFDLTRLKCGHQGIPVRV